MRFNTFLKYCAIVLLSICGTAFAADNSSKILSSAQARELEVLKLTSQAEINALTQKYDLAMMQATQAINLQPAFAPAYMVRGLVHEIKEEFAEAILEYNLAIKVDPSFLEALTDRAAAQIKLCQAENALASYKQVAIHDVRYKSPVPNRWNGIVSFAKNRLEQAANEDSDFQRDLAAAGCKH